MSDEKLNKPIEEYTSLELAIYACNCGNDDDRIDEVAKMIEAYTTAAVKPYKEAVRQSESQRWIPASERKPKKGVLVAIGHAEDQWVCAGEYAGKNIWYNQFSDDDVNVTHWQPLPSPPIEEKGEHNHLTE